MATNDTRSSAMASAASEIRKFKINDLCPLGSGAQDGLYLETAHAMLCFFSAAMQDRDAVNSIPGGASNIDDLNGEQMSLALNGIAVLVAMHAFHRDAETGAE